MFLRDLPDCENEYSKIDGGVLVIFKYYAWDGCSGPTRDTDTNMRAGLVHDALYQMIRLGLIPAYRKADIDKEFREICKQDGMAYLRRAAFYRGVEVFGGSSIDPDAEKKIKIAPIGRKCRWMPELEPA
tara:strand:+ start:2102 stop:2488 length:387 start_codon:yes stop_codon:yes gene_type:complete